MISGLVLIILIHEVRAEVCTGNVLSLHVTESFKIHFWILVKKLILLLM